jgi:hypothetical protein
VVLLEGGKAVGESVRHGGRNCIQAVGSIESDPFDHASTFDENDILIRRHCFTSDAAAPFAFPNVASIKDGSIAYPWTCWLWL